MNWIEKVNTELAEKNEADSLVNKNLESVIKDFYEIAKSEAKKANDEVNQDGLNRFSCHVYKDKKPDEFYVQVDSAASNKIVKMIVTFTPNNQRDKNSTKDNFIRLERQINEKVLEEVIAVRFHHNQQTITFEPKLFDGSANTSQIGNQTLRRLLVEPVIRQYLQLPQESYEKGFGR